MRIVLLGAPGSGKGTQAQQLQSDHGWPQVSTGDLLRSAVAAGTDLGLKAKAVMDAGNLVSDDIVLGIIKDRLSDDDADAGFVLDGFPRNRAQALDLETVLSDLTLRLDAAVLMDVRFDILLKRLTGRRTCSKTGKLLNIYLSTRSASPSAVRSASRCKPIRIVFDLGSITAMMRCSTFRVLTAASVAAIAVG